jgi:hypothetical protein
MALFGRNRDVCLINKINNELVNNIISQQIGYYKYILGKNTTNIYGETTDKYLTDPVLINCLITRNDQSWSSDDLGPDVNRPLSFAFIKENLKLIQLVPEIGDIILYLNSFYEVNTIKENQLFVGKDPDYPYSEGLEQFGSSISIICDAHLIPADKLGISLER